MWPAGANSRRVVFGYLLGKAVEVEVKWRSKANKRIGRQNLHVVIGNVCPYYEIGALDISTHK